MENINPQNLANNLRTLLDFRKMKPSEFARLVGHSRGHISNILNKKKTNKTITFLVKTATAFGLELESALKLYCDDFDPSDLTYKGKRSIVIPYFFTITSLKDTILKYLNSDSCLVSSKTPISSKTFISFPMCIPFSEMNGKRIVCFSVDVDTGMAPLITLGDILTVDFNDRTPEEKQIYLTLIDDALKLRYAKQYAVEGTQYIKLWAEERRFSDDVINLSKHPYFPILGRVLTGTRMF